MNEKTELLNKLLRFRIPHYHDDFPLILFWSQRSGCTTLLKWFYFQTGLLKTALDYHPWIHFYDQQVYKKRSGHLERIRESLLKGKKKTVKLVRNPYKRAVSQFLILATNKGNEHWNNEWKKIRKYFYHHPDSPRGINFKQFLQYIRDASGYDNHFSPQYVEGEEYFVKNFIYLEHFNRDIGTMERIYGLKKSDPAALSKSSHHLSPSMTLKGKYAECEITWDTFRSNRFPTYESFYDPEAVALVNTIFHKDFEMYGYRKVMPK